MYTLNHFWHPKLRSLASFEKKALCAAQQVIRRAEMALVGVPEETRKMLDEGSTAYMRPLPGAARMYPETDVLPITISQERWEMIETPELLTVKATRFEQELGLDEALAQQMAYSEYLGLFERALDAGVKPTLAARTLLGTLRELRREGVAVEFIDDEALLTMFLCVEDGKVAKEAIPELIRAIAAGSSVEEAIVQVAPPIEEEELVAMIRKILDSRADFVKERGRGALGPLMGVVMKEARGRVDGKVISDLLRRELESRL